MTHLLIIAVFLLVLITDAAGAVPLAPGRAWLIAGAVAASMFIIWLCTHIAIIWCSRRLDATGRVQWARRGERIVAMSRVLAVCAHAAAVLLFGWLEAVRQIMGNLVLVDELVAVAPPICVFVAGWASLYPIDRRMREAVMIRALDEGHDVQVHISLRDHVLSFVRHHILLIALPVVLVIGWAEAIVFLAPKLGLADLPAGARSLVMIALQLAGAMAIFICAPWLMRHIWRTTPLGEGELRDRLSALLRAHRVRVRELLIWDTRGALVNGAVMGVLAPVRYVLLTDALLASLTQDEVQAVAAHEVAHVRHRHILWLAGTVVATLVLVGIGVDQAALRLVGRRLEEGPGLIGAGLVMLAVTGVIFGWVSRRFEWQADAFAARCMSRSVDQAVTEEGASVMSRALARVASLNHMSPRAPSWRHGSIASRQARLARLAARRMPPRGMLPIDRQAATIKAAIAGAGLVAAAFVALDLWFVLRS